MFQFALLEHSLNYYFLLSEFDSLYLSKDIFTERRTSSKIYISRIEQESRISFISCFRFVLLVCGISCKSSSVCTDKALAISTKTGRLNFVFPVSIWLMCVTDICTFSASCSWDRLYAFLNLRMRCPIS